MSKWFDPIPVYVTRKSADGYIGTLTLGAWVVLPTLLLAGVNAIGWGAYGLFALAKAFGA